jgi:CRP-like cAMP-binding protein
MPFTNTVGDLIGEVAMLQKSSGKGGARALTVMAHTTCVFLALNEEIFKLLIEEKARKEIEVIV